MGELVGLDGKKIGTVDTMLDTLIKKQAELVQMDLEVGEKIKALQAKANAEMEAIAEKAKVDAEALRAPFMAEFEKYRAEVKEKFGVADGERMSVVQTMFAVKKLMDMNQ